MTSVRVELVDELANQLHAQLLLRESRADLGEAFANEQMLRGDGTGFSWSGASECGDHEVVFGVKMDAKSVVELVPSRFREVELLGFEGLRDGAPEVDEASVIVSEGALNRFG